MHRYRILLVVSSLTACSGPAPGTPESQLLAMQKARDVRVDQVKETVSDVPAWFLKAPIDDLSLYGTGSATSGDVQFAIERATLVAKNDIASRLSSKIASEMKEYISDTGRLDNPVTIQRAEQAIKEVVTETEIVGYNVSKTEVQASGTLFRAYALVQYPLGDANKILADKIRKDSELNLKSEASKTFSELEGEIRASRDIKASQDKPQ